MNNDGIHLTHTTAFRLSVYYAVSFCALTIIALLLAYHHVMGEVNAQINTGLRAELKSLVLTSKQLGTPQLQCIIERRSTPASIEATNSGDSGPRFYLLINAAGEKLAGSLPHWQLALAQQQQAPHTTLALNTPQALRHLVENRHSILLRSYQQQLSDGSHLLIAQSLNEQAELQAELWRLVAIVILLMISAGIIGGTWIGRAVVRSLTNVTQAADRIMEGDLSQRIETHDRGDEFAQLAKKLNLMLARIETLMADLREVTTNVAHDLRTPVTRLRTHAEMALLQSDDGGCRLALHTAVQQSEMLVQMLDGIMNIARVEADLPLSWRQHDLAAICSDALELYEPLIEEKQLELTAELPTTPLIIHCDAQLLAQAIGNLLDNAIKYTPAGGSIHLGLTAHNNQLLLLQLKDSGPGIPIRLRDKALQRFVRLDNSRSQPGNGLGLPLVAAIVSRHHGKMTLEDADPGSTPPGLAVNLLLPFS